MRRKKKMAPLSPLHTLGAAGKDALGDGVGVINRHSRPRGLTSRRTSAKTSKFITLRRARAGGLLPHIGRVVSIKGPTLSRSARKAPSLRGTSATLPFMRRRAFFFFSCTPPSRATLDRNTHWGEAQRAHAYQIFLHLCLLNRHRMRR
jgi:hypothetical protein